MLSVIHGNLFDTSCQTLVNTVNCVGAMGAGIALECRLRWPALYAAYQAQCRAGQIRIGRPWLYAHGTPWVLNFPTKQDWRAPSQERYLHEGLHTFAQHYAALGITSVAFPLLGAQNGGLAPERSLAILQAHLAECPLSVEVYVPAVTVPDTALLALREAVLRQAAADLAAAARVPVASIARLREALRAPAVLMLSDLVHTRVLEASGLERVLAAVARTGSEVSESQHRFDF